MGLTMYNMEFGESFLLSEEKENLVIDLGSDLPSFNYAPVFADIMAKGKGKSTSLLLTHFHQDHMEGVLHPNFVACMPQLRRIYLPNLLGVPIPGEFDLLKSVIISEVLRAVLIRGRRRRLSLYALLLQIRSAHTQVVFLERGADFFVDNKPYHVLWPHIHAANGLSKKLQNKIYSWFGQLRQENAESDLFRAIEQYEFALVEEYRRLSEEDSDQMYRSLPQLDELENAVWTTTEALVQYMDDRDLQYAKAFAYTLKNLGNQLSIVFQDAQADSSGTLPILMTGDVPKSVLNKILLGKDRYRKYAVIKAPHHGTKTYFTALLPPCDKIAISNGKAHLPSRGVITHEYSTVYRSRSSHPVQLICSNSRCSLRTPFAPAHCCPPPCVCGIALGTGITII